jgi:predicted RNase H-like HicB family nuclease
MNLSYVAIVEKDPDSDWGVSFPDFPGCISAGATADEAVREAHEALQFHVDGMLEDGETLPDPNQSDAVYLRGNGPDRFVALVQVRVPARARRLNITIDASLLERIQARTSNVSGFLATAAQEKLKSDSGR